MLVPFSDIFPHQLLSVSSLNTDTTPESLHSLEHVSYDNRVHLLSGLSPSKLDKQFSDYSSSSKSEDDRDWWEGEDNVAEYLVEEVDDDVFIKDEFEGRELSIVFEETEAEDSNSEEASGEEDEEKVVTGVCTIGNSIQIENHVSSVKAMKKGKQKRVTFAEDPPVFISRKSSSISIKEDLLETLRENISSINPEETVEIKNCKKCKQENRFNVRMSLSLGTSHLKTKNFVFKNILRWFKRFL